MSQTFNLNKLYKVYDATKIRINNKHLVENIAEMTEEIEQKVKKQINTGKLKVDKSDDAAR